MATADKRKHDAMDVDSAIINPEDEGFIESLDDPLQQIISQFLDSGSKSCSDVLEVQLRQQCFKLVKNSTSLLNFWKNALQAVYHIVLFAEKDKEVPAASAESTKGEASNETTTHSRYKNALAKLTHIRRLPLILLEDILDVLPIETAYTFWNDTVSAADVSALLFGTLLWHPAPKQHPCWLPFLKLSNKFLRRLQERPCETANVMQKLSTVYPISEKSATKKWGSHNADNLVQLESEETFEEEAAATASIDTTTKMNASSSSSAAATDYNFYETFWKLQHDLRSPNAIVVSDFLNRLKTVLHAFQSHPVSSSTAAAATSSSITASMTPSSTSEAAAAASSAMELDDEASSTDADAAMSTQLRPFLTQSRLLPIQLTDPVLRSVVLSQFWIVAHHLLSLSQGPQLRSQLQSQQKVAESLMLPQQLGFLQSSAVLQISEPQWQQWKKDKCHPDLDEKPKSSSTTAASSSSSNETNNNAAVAVRRKRKRQADDKEEEKAYEWQGGKADLINISQKMRKSVPSAKDHLEDYVDALDPDAGIDAEYHPKNDAIFTWRALRLLAVDDLQDFSQIRSDGDFEGMVRDIYHKKHGVDIPGEAPAVHEDDDEEEDEEVHDEQDQNAEKEETGENEDSGMVDTEMKDAHEDADAKKSPENVVDARAKDDSDVPKDKTSAMDFDADTESQGKSEHPRIKKEEQVEDLVPDKPAPDQVVVENGGSKADGNGKTKFARSKTPPRGSRSRSPLVGKSPDDGHHRNEGGNSRSRSPLVGKSHDDGRRRNEFGSSRDQSRSRAANGHRDNRRNYDERGGYEHRRDDRDRGGGEYRGDSSGRQRGPQSRGSSRGDDRQGEEARRDEWRRDRSGGGDRNQRSRGGDRDDRGDRGSRGGRRGGGGHRR